MNMTTNMTFKQTFLGSLIAGAGTAVVNHLWKLIYENMSGYSIPEIVHAVGVTMSSFIPLIIAGIVFFFLQRLGNKGRVAYTVGTIVLALLSLYGTFNQPMPDGSATPMQFTLLTLPMHLVAMVGALMIPKLAARVKA